MSFLESTGWKKFVAKAYGIGAAIVITGALFKIMHFPFAGEILTIGMAVEALIFLISAFEPLPKEYHWENIYPELVAEGAMAPIANGGIQQIGTSGNVGINSGGFGAGVPNLDLGIDSSTTEGLKAGIKNFSDSIDKMSSLSQVVDASTRLATDMNKASGAMSTMSESGVILSEAYKKNVQVVQNFNEQSMQSLDQMKSGYDFYRGQIETLGRTMGAVNSSYELYLQEANKVQNGYSALNGEINNLLTSVKSSVSETQKLGSQMANLNGNVEQLNSVYGSMLTAVSSVIGK